MEDDDTDDEDGVYYDYVQIVATVSRAALLNGQGRQPAGTPLRECGYKVLKLS
jgi:hypothetical protein